ncbi:dihydroorotate dehydrogenase [Colletotrichum graminicola M1.001]|uniref:Dihydroorotate dehydrogenase n=1 Tax=Colletotrichum graminicola (strain M1.001 / M2 / FGSC 10212) TaxID=645133 RepID=E3QVX3_COLGM|nr:dihydroorotate dehydrogenase [Colletotrichum graminicola M1.001]EFQ35011.1 dihydroorotate dehydrogenase [Colletotrichum graminicola M1.001]
MDIPPPPALEISPPLLNSANPWCTTFEDIDRLHASPHTGAITTRTSMIGGFAHDDASNQYAFFNPSTAEPSRAPNASTQRSPPGVGAGDVASLNNLGYSPHPLGTYLDFVGRLPDRVVEGHRKLVIVSVTGSPAEVAECYRLIARFSRTTPHPLAMEVNLSCPNIAAASPPASDRAQLLAYLAALPRDPEIPVGLKTPPYTHIAHFAELIGALRQDATVVSPTSMLKGTGDGEWGPRLPGSGLGGMAGAPLHPLALGNVKTITDLLLREPELLHIKVIGVGGVSDADGFRRMKSVGAYAVGVGTALGREGVEVFEKIASQLHK